MRRTDAKRGRARLHKKPHRNEGCGGRYYYDSERTEASVARVPWPWPGAVLDREAGGRSGFVLPNGSTVEFHCELPCFRRPRNPEGKRAMEKRGRGAGRARFARAIEERREECVD